MTPLDTKKTFTVLKDSGRDREFHRPPDNCQRAVYGIDLSNYFPNERYYNSVVYLHKKFLPKPQEIQKDEKEKSSTKEKKNKKHKKKVDKGQQFNSDALRTEIPVYRETGINVAFHNDSMEQYRGSAQFAKNLVPVVIPPENEQFPMYYTIKATTKPRKQTHPKVSDHFEGAQEIKYKKEKSRKVETYRTERAAKESFSVKETISYSSHSDTLNELHIDQSLCCSFSDVSEQKQTKKDKKEKKDSQKLIASESFEALAAEYRNGSDAKIKVYLMNDSDKNLLTENIRVPILNAIKECISEINTRGKDEALTTVHRSIKCNTQKLDNIMDKISCLERKIDEHIAKEPRKQMIVSSPKERKEQQMQQVKKVKQKRSALEHLEEDDDFIELKETDNEEFLQSIDLSARRKNQAKSEVLELTLGDVETEIPEKKREVHLKSEMGGGEMGTNTGMGAKPSRVPARFCWTGGVKNN